MIDTTNLVVSSNLLISTSKWFRRFSLAFSRTNFDLSRTAPILRRYPAGSTFGSGAFGRGMVRMLGVDIFLEKLGVVGVLIEYAEEMEPFSIKLEPPVLILPSLAAGLFFRENNPILEIE
jgi:hypothetical protein